jgi:hypothetical protein
LTAPARRELFQVAARQFIDVRKFTGVEWAHGYLRDMNASFG